MNYDFSIENGDGECTFCGENVVGKVFMQYWNTDDGDEEETGLCINCGVSQTREEINKEKIALKEADTKLQKIENKYSKQIALKRL